MYLELFFTKIKAFHYGLNKSVYQNAKLFLTFRPLIFKIIFLLGKTKDRRYFNEQNYKFIHKKLTHYNCKCKGTIYCQFLPIKIEMKIWNWGREEFKGDGLGKGKRRGAWPTTPSFPFQVPEGSQVYDDRRVECWRRPWAPKCKQSSSRCARLGLLESLRSSG